mmetsp:Transcript_20501/g.39523  ORF Transcript_20501/g.39523 Transcript_20501/m.39523 type:complete len:81 (-) Transcript_20501:164-406(-)
MNHTSEVVTRIRKSEEDLKKSRGEGDANRKQVGLFVPEKRLTHGEKVLLAVGANELKPEDVYNSERIIDLAGVEDDEYGY